MDDKEEMTEKLVLVLVKSTKLFLYRRYINFGMNSVEINVDVAVEVDDASESDTVTKVDLVDDVDDDGVDGAIMWLCGDVVIDGNNNDTSGSRVNVESYLGVVSKMGEVTDALFGAFVVIFENVLSVSG